MKHLDRYLEVVFTLTIMIIRIFMIITPRLDRVKRKIPESLVSSENLQYRKG